MVRGLANNFKQKVTDTVYSNRFFGYTHRVVNEVDCY
jgi:hypothetical protein